MANRPTGVTILGVLAILLGIVGLIGGIALVGLYVLISSSSSNQSDLQALIGNSTLPGLQSQSASTILLIFLIIGLVLLVTGILYLATGIGFFGGKGWSWTLGIIISIISIISS